MKTDPDSTSPSGLKQRWNELPVSVRTVVGGAVIGVTGNYATVGLNLLIKWLSGESSSQLIQFTIIIIGIYTFFDTLHKARLNRIESKIDRIV